MIYKLLGATMIVASCGGFGFSIVMSHRKEVRLLNCLIETIRYMKCELQYRYIALPELCEKAAAFSTGHISQYFKELSKELGAQICPDTKSCCLNAGVKVKDMPNSVNSIIALLADTLGTFDLKGQLEGFDYALAHAGKLLENLTFDQDRRLRSYQTLALCAGAALAILLV